jgi:hypothetical protein
MKIRLGIDHLPVKRIGSRLDGFGVHAIGNHRGAAFGDIGRRKAAGEIDIVEARDLADGIVSGNRNGILRIALCSLKPASNGSSNS